jgi:hypothetical protein
MQWLSFSRWCFLLASICSLSLSRLVSVNSTIVQRFHIILDPCSYFIHMSFLNMSLIKITYNPERAPSLTRSALPHANPRTIPTSTKQRESTSHAKVQSLHQTLLQEPFNATIPHTVINYNYAYTSAQLKSCAEALLNKLPVLETTTPNPFPSNDFQ